MGVFGHINVHGSSDNTSAPVKCNVLDSSEESELISGVNINKSNSSSEHDVLSDEQLEDAKQSEVPSGQERFVICLMISVIPYIWCM
jgi:hypothetical protein